MKTVWPIKRKIRKRGHRYRRHNAQVILSNTINSLFMIGLRYLIIGQRLRYSTEEEKKRKC